VDDFINKELREPYKSFLDYFIKGVRGLREGYFSKLRHGKVAPETLKNDEKCFGADQENAVYQIAYFLVKGELGDIETVLDDFELLYYDTTHYCAIYETTQILYDKCYLKKNCDINSIIENAENHLMKFVEIAMNFLDLTTERAWTAINSPRDFEDTMSNIGSEIGDLIVSLFGI
jgi:hypothetical protein